MPTPHLSAQPGDFADVVLMPGDPLRAKLIAESYFEKPRLVNDVRNMYGYTGMYKGRRVSVLAHGMGIPSCSIYATELIREYGVKTLIRVGSCGVLAADIELGDVILALGASTDSKVNRIRFMDHDFAAVADYALLAHAVDAARERGTPVRVGNVFSSDLFYSPQTAMFDVLEKMGVLAVEMEIAGLYGLAAEFGARALGILSVSDHIRKGTHLSADERRTRFQAMIEIALETARRSGTHVRPPA
ncbi:MAG: purine-nucleoside phosphorylase [Candidatus Eisenbacteria bacterium]|nr:purine-nucleoside phosphorylase [Candidatus Eisenbacteria bacterium]